MDNVQNGLLSVVSVALVTCDGDDVLSLCAPGWELDRDFVVGADLRDDRSLTANDLGVVAGVHAHF